jgi:predicted phosphodiesterase
LSKDKLMKIRLLSDLHLEGMQGYSAKVRAWAQHLDEDVLVLAGDIAVGIPKVVEALYYFKAQGFPRIIYVPGNHEFYHHDMDMQALQLAVDTVPDCKMLNCNEIIKIGGVSFFGGTLWTEFDCDPIAEAAARRGINDFRVIGNWSTKQCAQEYQRQSQYIKWAYENTPGKKVIVTHFLPARECVAERYRDAHGIESTLNKYFSNDLGSWIETLEDVIWMYGHTHDAQDHMIGNTRLVSNPMGYYGEYTPPAAKFDSNKVIDV